jgi:hypothetical protein
MHPMELLTRLPCNDLTSALARLRSRGCVPECRANIVVKHEPEIRRAKAKLYVEACNRVQIRQLQEQATNSLLPFCYPIR